MPRPRHQRGWLTKEGGLIYGNYRRYVTAPATGKQKKKHVVLVLGPISQMKNWEARQKLEGIIAEDLGVRQIQQNRPDPETSFGWFVRHRFRSTFEARRCSSSPIWSITFLAMQSTPTHCWFSPRPNHSGAWALNPC